MRSRLQIHDMTVEVIRKNIKNVHLRVYPPAGRVRVSAPTRMKMGVLRGFVISRLGWIRRQQEKLRKREREFPREYTERETHFLWGKPYFMQVVEGSRVGVELQHDTMILYARPGSDIEQRREIVQEWYRRRLKEALPAIRDKWAPVIGVAPKSVTVRRMKTLWGSCTPRRATIRISLNLAQKPPQCLDYIVVHELIHLLEPSHNHRFFAHMDRFLPNWRHHREELNSCPLPQVG